MKLTVLMPAYNAAKYIKEAIDSILNQTYQDFELLIINDGSTDSTEEIIQKCKDQRIKYIKKDINTGLIDTLNYGFSLVNTKYLVRMDADDISHTERLEKLHSFMERNPNIDICGSSYFYFNSSKGIIENSQKIRPENHNDIKTTLLSYCSFTHGTAIFRLHNWRIFKMKYNQDYSHAEDYKMITEAAQNLILHNLQEPLYYYRIHDAQVSSKFNTIQFDNSNKVKLEQLFALEIRPTTKEEEIYLKFIWTKGIANLDDFDFIKTVTSKMIENNQKLKRYDCKTLENYLKYLLHYNTILYFIRKQYSPKLLRELFNLKHKPWQYLKIKDIASITVKSIIFHKA